jgi:hypothetical protein
MKGRQYAGAYEGCMAMRSQRRLRRQAGVLLAVLALLACGSLPAAASAARHIALGSYVPNLSQHPASIDRYARLMGRKPVIVSSYKQWDVAPFVGRELRAVWSRGAVPMITWEPLSYHGRRYPLRAIARGRYDGYLRRSARAAAAWRKPILLRFAHEMNGNWYPWGRGVDGNTAHRYKAVWRHVVRIFRHAGADNVSWVWTPNVDQGQWPFSGLYPGDAWVDWVGFDGFNWGYGGRSLSFGEIFNRSYRVLARISHRPMIVAETGTYGRGKAAWISQALNRQVPRMHRIKALVWFNHPANGVDLRFSHPSSALRAFRRAARADRYRTTRERLLSASLWLPGDASSLPGGRGM